MSQQPYPIIKDGICYHLADIQQYLTKIHENCNGCSCEELIEYIYNSIFNIPMSIIYPSKDTIENHIKNNLNFKKIEPPLIVGDILVFSGFTEEKIHLGLYIGKDKFIHSYNGNIRINSINNRVWRLFLYDTFRYSNS